MSARDKIHIPVKNALIKDGWNITADPFTIQYDDVTLQADLAATEQPLEAERGERKIVVEIKSFLGPSPIHELEGALGQYQVHDALLKLIHPERKLYLAVGTIAYSNVFSKKAVQVIVKQYDLALLVVDVTKEEVVKWIESLRGEV